MSIVRGRRGGSPVDGRRAVRGLRHAATGPVRTGSRSAAPRRPGQRRSARRPARTPVPAAARRRPLFTGRAVLLGALVLLLALTLAGPVRQYLAGRAELVELAAEQRSLEQRARELERQLDRQDDPAWIAREARDRLTYVRPGDRLVVVDDGRSGDAADGPSTPGTGQDPDLSWYEGLLRSLEVADGDRTAAPDVGLPADGGVPAPADGKPGG
ncbi:septum formation initiator family protein [Geodermatophilus sp. YIM 151500]|uniref:FtsB family cell division protein n=1 Tax=Geodermatophilus sp. YIM 151500 TaxID=2984531 RepID=UPI0021E44A0B|nr:septum formation initiator family protein [Geodermatophilus sp. YIM 151500]MCV2489557.1 septum formation initiator family protein [Geodermatophilus sp. YIM 151500]